MVSARAVGQCDRAPEGPCFSWSPDSRRLALAGNSGFLVVAATGDVKGRVLVATAARSPSWSPDGRRIGFVEGRGSQTEPNRAQFVALSGGSVRSLATSAAGIVWSPDSSSAVVHDGDLIVTSADATRRRWIVQPRLGAAKLPRWLPGSRSLVYVYESGGSEAPELRRVDADGSRNRRIARLPHSVDSLSLTPDGATAIVGVRGDGSSAARLYAMRFDGTQARLLDVGGDVSFPAWSPDGIRIAFLCGRHLCVADADGSDRRRLTDVRRSYSDAERVGWSPDGARIVLSTTKGIYEIGSEGGKVRRLPGFPAEARNAVWSPDGTRIAYESFQQVTISRRDGSGAISVETGEFWAAHPDWSPDGRSLVIAKEYNAQCPRLCPPFGLVIFSSEGKLIRELTGPDDYLFSTWSPDGRGIAVERGSRIWSIDVAGGQQKRLQGFGQGFWSDSNPSWQPRCTRTGTKRGEKLAGTPGRDLLCALGGDDRLVGGGGEDRLFGHEGDDRIDARDGGFDVVGCGPGSDVVVADRADLVGSDCERVTRA